MFITKADGTTEEFKPIKLQLSLKRAGAKSTEVNSIVADIERLLTPGMQTQEIYKRAFELLRDSDDPVAAKYSLRRAIFGLGPTGFPFEDFLAYLFEAQGYKTKRRLTLRGKCVTHEIDLAAYSPAHSFVAEAKFHARPGIKSDIQVILYSYARYLDLQTQRICKGDTCGIISLSVITNTKFTQAAVDYAHCVGVGLLSWDQPRHGSLHELIEKHGVYPITVLTRLSGAQKQALLSQGIVLCTDLIAKQAALANLGLSRQKMTHTLDEVTNLCRNLAKK